MILDIGNGLPNFIKNINPQKSASVRAAYEAETKHTEKKRKGGECYPCHNSQIQQWITSSNLYSSCPVKSATPDKNIRNQTASSSLL